MAKTIENQEAESLTNFSQTVRPKMTIGPNLLNILAKIELTDIFHPKIRLTEVMLIEKKLLYTRHDITIVNLLYCLVSI